MSEEDLRLVPMQISKNTSQDKRLNKSSKNASLPDARPKFMVTYGDNCFANIYQDYSVFADCKIEYVVKSFLGNNVSSFNDPGEWSTFYSYDCWLSPYKSETALDYLYKNVSEDKPIENKITFTNLGQRDYFPSLRSFSSEDRTHDCNNDYAYCSTDPVNYKDTNGLNKNCYSDAQNAYYTSAIAYQISLSGCTSFVPSYCDCADTASYTDYLGNQATGHDSSYSNMQNEFSRHVDKAKQEKTGSTNSKKEYAAARETVSSKDYHEGSNQNVTQKTDGWAKSDSDSVKNEVRKQLSEPGNIHAGDTLSYKKGSNDTGNWNGHIVTILAVIRDSEGNATGFAYCEDHMTK